MESNSIKKTILNLKEILLDPNCERLSKSSIKGFLGEMYVKLKLEKEGASVKLIGNQSRFDLEVNVNIKIDVKSSTIKGSAEYPDWGWALRSKALDKITFTHLVCVAFNMQFDAVKFVVIDVDNLELFPAPGGQYNSIKRSFSLMLDGIEYPENDKYFSSCKDLLLKGKVKIVESKDDLLPHLLQN